MAILKKIRDLTEVEREAFNLRENNSYLYELSLDMKVVRLEQCELLSGFGYISYRIKYKDSIIWLPKSLFDELKFEDYLEETEF